MKHEVKEETMDQMDTELRGTLEPRKSSRIAAKRVKVVVDVEDLKPQYSTGLVVKAEDEEPQHGTSSTPPTSNNKAAKMPAIKDLVKKGKGSDQKMFGLELRLNRWSEHSIDPNGFNIDESLRGLRDSEDGLVSRVFLANTYGGNSQLVLPPISPQKYAEHGFTGKFMYLGCDYQPCAPTVPGSPGLWISVDVDTSDDWKHGIVRTFTKVQDHTPRLWQYQGQYKLRRSRPISQAEWEQQPPSLRNKWISDLKSQGWGTNMRARIYGRKNLEPNMTEDYIKDVQKRGLDKEITKEEIAVALQSGQEKMVVYTMECVGYEDNFQRHLIDKHLARAHKAESESNEEEPQGKRKRGQKKPKLEEAISQPAKKQRRRVKVEA